MCMLDTIFLICIGIGLLYACVTLLFGDSGGWLDHFQIPVLQPLTLVSGITAFGGSGFLLLRLTSFTTLTTILLSLLSGAIIAILSYFIWIEPMNDAETSTGYSIMQLVGKVGEVWTTVPATGLGEIIIPMVNGTTNHMAASWLKEPIPEGTKVIVVEVKDHVLYVKPH